MIVGPSTLTPEFEGLIDGVRAAGHPVNVTTVGTPQPLPPELATVAVRVLQEMLTNAIKHGDLEQPVLLEHHWEGELRLEVSNHGPPQFDNSGFDNSGFDNSGSDNTQASRQPALVWGRLECATGGPALTEPIRVLLVEDQELFCAGPAVIIINAHDGLEVIGQASSGTQTIAAVAEFEPDVV